MAGATATPLPRQTGTTTTQPAQPAPTSVDIAPAGSAAAPAPRTPAATTAPAAATPSQSAAASATSAGQTAPSVGAAQGAQGMFTPDQATTQAAASVQQANLNVASAYNEIQKQQQALDAATAAAGSDPIAGPAKLQSATTALNSAYSQLSQAEDSLSTANTTYSTSLTAAIKSNTVDPSQVDLATRTAAKADADAAEATARTKLLTDDTPGGQRALNAAQAGLSSANAASAQATADATKLKAGPEADALRQQGALSKAQADQITAQIGTPDNPGPLIRKANEEVNTQVATTDQVKSQSNLNDATARKQDADAGLSKAQADAQNALLAAGGPQATVAATLGQANQSNATAAAALAKIQQDKLGPTYGLQDQLNAIKTIHDQVFGPSGSGSPQERQKQADDLLSQYFNATVGGTTPYAASVAAANAGLTAYGTQMSGTNALQQAQASRAASYAGLAGSELGTLAGMNAYAPKGSTAMAGAFQSLQDDMARRMAAQFPTAPIPNAPPLPAFLQQFGPAGPGGAPPAGAAATPGGPAGLAGPAGAPAGAPAPVPGGGPVFNPQGSTAAMNQAGYMDTPAGRAAMSLVNPALMGTPGAVPATPATAATPATPATPSMPASIANYAGQPGTLTPQQAFNQGFTSNTPAYPNVLAMYGLNMPSPMQMLGGNPYVGMGSL